MPLDGDELTQTAQETVDSRTRAMTSRQHAVQVWFALREQQGTTICEQRTMDLSRTESVWQGVRIVLVISKPNIIPPPPSLCIGYGLVQATAGVGTVLIWDLIQVGTECSAAT